LIFLLCSFGAMNGLLEAALAAFLVGFYNEELLADSNSDDIWNQDDIDLWTDRFWTDYDAMQE